MSVSLEIHQAYQHVRQRFEGGQDVTLPDLERLAKLAPHLAVRLFKSFSDRIAVSVLDLAINAALKDDMAVWMQTAPFYHNFGRGEFNELIVTRLREIGRDNLVADIAERLKNYPDAHNSFAQLVEVARQANKLGGLKADHINEYARVCAAENYEREQYTGHWVNRAGSISTAIAAVANHAPDLLAGIHHQALSHGLARLIYQGLYDQMFGIEENPEGMEAHFERLNQAFDGILKSHPDRVAIIRRALAIAYFHLEKELDDPIVAGGTKGPVHAALAELIESYALPNVTPETVAVESADHKARTGNPAATQSGGGGGPRSPSSTDLTSR